MQVILLEDVPDVGKKYEEHEVADGYGTNYLLPNGLAQVANERTRAKYSQQKEELEKKRREQREKKAEMLDQIDGESVTIATKTGDQGQLFAGVYAEDIAEAVNDAVDMDMEVAPDDIDREQPLQKVGEYEVDVAVLEESATVAVSVESK